MVSFKDQNPSYDYSVASVNDSTYSIVDNDDADLGNFFSRPIKIQSFDWGTGTTLFEVFNPWTNFFENPRVLNRISNFALLRAKLCVKVVINGNGFHYGRAILSYNPLPTLDQFTVDRGFFEADIVESSQRPHIYLDPTTSQGGSMTLPFVWYDNYMEIPDQEWRNMGELTLHTMQMLKHANGASDSVTVSVFAWAEDVALAVPTSSEPGALAPQAGSEDEYGKGPVSRPASVVARVAGNLKQVPYIGNYARATQLAASAISSIASTFGYSRPNNISDISYYRPTLMGNMANTNVGDTAVKLSVDAKQELTVDPTTIGVAATDEMTISSIACRESYLTSFPWKISDTAETHLWQAEVTPMIWRYLDLGTPGEMHLPACAFAAMPFRNWYGSMKYRFQVVSSSFHKGRLKIVYDPHGFQSNEYNTNYTYIIDIAEEKDFTVQIGWGSDKPYCLIAPPGVNGRVDTIPPFSVFENATAPGNRANGVLRVYVVNELTIPNSTIDNDVNVNVFVSAGDDIQFRNPTSQIENYSFFPEPQVGEEPRSVVDLDAYLNQMSPQMGNEDGTNLAVTDTTSEPSKPLMQNPEHTMLSPVSTDDAYDHVFFGETIVSFRQLLKRYNLHSRASRIGAFNGTWRIEMNAFPYHKGYAPNAIYPTGLPEADAYNFSRMTLMNWLTPAYLARRGGVKWKALYQDTGPVNFMGKLEVIRTSGSWPAYSQTELPWTSTSEAAAVRALHLSSYPTSSGSTQTQTQIAPTIEWESPFQQNTRFAPGKRADYTADATFADAFIIGTDVSHSSGTRCSLDLHCAAGEDFSLFFFLGSPIVRYNVPFPSV
jgi:hypothetical protein